MRAHDTKTGPADRIHTPHIGIARSRRRASRIEGSRGTPARRSRAAPPLRGGQPPAPETSRSDRARPDTRRRMRAAAAHTSSRARPRPTGRRAHATPRDERNWGLFGLPGPRPRSFCLHHRHHQWQFSDARDAHGSQLVVCHTNDWTALPVRGARRGSGQAGRDRRATMRAPRSRSGALGPRERPPGVRGAAPSEEDEATRLRHGFGETWP